MKIEIHSQACVVFFFKIYKTQCLQVCFFLMFSFRLLPAFTIMTSLLLRSLASSVTMQLVQVSRINLISSSPIASAFRRLCTIAVAQRTPFLSSTSGASIHPPSSPSGTCRHGPSLLGQCQHLACIQPSAGMKTKSSLKRRCKDCFFVVRRGRLFVYCKTHPRHKQRQG